MKKILYDSKKCEYKSVFGALSTNQKCKFSIDINKNEQPISATMCVRRDQQSDFLSYEMNSAEETENHIRFSCEISLKKL